MGPASSSSSTTSSPAAVRSPGSPTCSSFAAQRGTRYGARCAASRPRRPRKPPSAPDHLAFPSRQPGSCHSMFVFKAAVVGAGTMGGEIAQVIASAGLPVVLKDVEQRFVDQGLEKARQVSQGQLGGLVKKEKISQ